MSKSKLLHTIVAGSMALSLFGAHPVMVHAVDNQPFFHHTDGSYAEDVVDIDTVNTFYPLADTEHLRELAKLSMQYKKIYDAYPETLSSYEALVQWLSSMLTPDAKNETLTNDRIERIVAAYKKAASNNLKDQMNGIKAKLDQALDLAQPDNKPRVQATIDKLTSMISGGDINPANSEVADTLKAAKALIDDPNATPDVPGYVAPAPGPTEAETFRTDFADVLNKNTGNVSVDDETRVDEAIAKLATLKPDSQGELATEKQLLQDLKNKITETKKVNTEVADFRRDHGTIAAKSVDDVTAQDEPAVVAALDKLKTLSPDAQNQLATEKANLEALKAKVDKLKAIDTEVATYKNDHNTILNKTVDTVAVSDERLIDDALTKLDALSPDAQGKLTAERNLLLQLRDKVNALKASEDEVRAFKAEHAEILAKTPANVEVDDEAKVEAALNKLNSLSPDAQTALASEKANLEALKTKIAELKAIDAEVDGFKADHEEILNKTPETVTVEDERAVDEALAALGNLSEGAQGKLEPEANLLNNLEVSVAEKKALVEEINGFKTKHEAVLNPDNKAGFDTDLVPVDAALADWNNLSVEAKEALAQEKEYLDSFKAAVLAAQAQEEAYNAYLKDHADIINKPLNAVVREDKKPVDAALSAYDQLDPAVQSRLSDVYQDLLAKKEKIAGLKPAKKKALPKTGEMAVSVVPAVAGALSIFAAILKKRSED